MRENNKSFIIQGIECRQSPLYPNYAASKCGKVFRISTGKEMSQTARKTIYTNAKYYYSVRVCHDNLASNARVNVLVADAWLEKPSELHLDVNHIDGNTLNNTLDNLEWTTKSQNQRHALDIGLKQKGEDLYNAALTNEQVHEVCKLLVDKMRIKDISDRFEVSKDIIRKIKAGDTYFDIRVLYNIDHDYKTTCSESTVRWVCERINEGYADKSIADMTSNKNVTAIEVKRIRYKIRYKIISDEYF